MTTQTLNLTTRELELVLADVKTQVATPTTGVIPPQELHERAGELWPFLNEAEHISLLSAGPSEWVWMYGAKWGGNYTRLERLDNPGVLPDPPFGVPGDELRIPGFSVVLVITEVVLKKLHDCRHPEALAQAQANLGSLSEEEAVTLGAQGSPQFTRKAQYHHGHLKHNWQQQHTNTPHAWENNPWVILTNFTPKKESTIK